MSQLPPADPDTRLVIDSMAQESGWPALHAELERVDPATAARLQPTDAQRIQRALEVYYLTGQPMSALIARGRASGPALSHRSRSRWSRAIAASCISASRSASRSCWSWG